MQARSSATPATRDARPKPPSPAPASGSFRSSAAATATASSSSEALDRRAHPSLDQPLSPARQRLRAPRPKSRSLRPPRHDPPHAATPLDKPLIRNPNFPERLL